MGTRGVVASGHYLATAAGFRIMERGSNAIDAAAAMNFCLNIVEPNQNGIGGEVPIMIYSAKERRTFVICGQGWSPKALTIDWCRENGIDLIPGDGYIPACVPAVVGTWATALARFGTMTFTQVLEPAIELAESGFPVYASLREYLAEHAAWFKDRYPSTADVYLPGGRVPDVGEIIRNPDFAETLRTICAAEESARGKGRIAGIEAGADAFYAGEITEKIIDFISGNPVLDASGAAHRGLLAYDDFAEWRATVEDPISISYRGLEVHKCPPWSQGPVFLQQLAILGGYDLKSMGDDPARSPEFLHTLIECAKLAFADREAYYGDPLFDKVPLDVLLSAEYAKSRRELIGPKASMDFRRGDAGIEIADCDYFDVRADNRRGMKATEAAKRSGKTGSGSGDTTQLVAADISGNMISATSSGGWIHSSPVIKGLGFALGTRAQMFYLNPSRPNALAPRKRPRTTLTPTIVTRGGKPYLAFGTPGGDSQDQWTLQFFLNFVDFGMDLQRALDSPHLRPQHVPESFYPRDAHPGRVLMEPGFPDEVLEELEKRGHQIQTDMKPVRMMAVFIDTDRGTISGGTCSTSPTGHAIGW